MNYEALFTAVGAVATFVLLAIPGFFFSRKKLITAQEARLMRQNGKLPAPGAVLTPLAKEILLEGKVK